jgi:ubiquinone biosynthesis protein UbiJ
MITQADSGTLIPMLIRPFEDLLNRGIDASTEASRMCRNLDGKTLEVDLDGLPFVLRLTPRDGRLHFVEEDDQAADCRIGGMPLSLMRLAITGDQDSLRSGTVTMSGDPALARDFERLLDLAKPDWEEELSRLVGDVVAHQLGNLARGLIEWGNKAGAILSQDAGEFLQEESRDLPTRFEVDEFLDDVDRLSADTSRVEKRIARLEKQGAGIEASE